MNVALESLDRKGAAPLVKDGASWQK